MRYIQTTVPVRLYKRQTAWLRIRVAANKHIQRLKGGLLQSRAHGETVYVGRLCSREGITGRPSAAGNESDVCTDFGMHAAAAAVRSESEWHGQCMWVQENLRTPHLPAENSTTNNSVLPLGNPDSGSGAIEASTCLGLSLELKSSGKLCVLA